MTDLRQEEVAGLIRSRLQEGFIKDPFVTVYIKEYNSKKVFVVGKVTKPGTFVYQDGMNIVQAITLAGGFSATAEKNQTIVTRLISGSEQRIQIPVDDISSGRSANFLLAPGDIVFVPESVLLRMSGGGNMENPAFGPANERPGGRRRSAEVLRASLHQKKVCGTRIRPVCNRRNGLSNKEADTKV